MCKSRNRPRSEFLCYESVYGWFLGKVFLEIIWTRVKFLSSSSPKSSFNVRGPLSQSILNVLLDGRSSKKIEWQIPFVLLLRSNSKYSNSFLLILYIVSVLVVARGKKSAGGSHFYFAALKALWVVDRHFSPLVAFITHRILQI